MTDNERNQNNSHWKPAEVKEKAAGNEPKDETDRIVELLEEDCDPDPELQPKSTKFLQGRPSPRKPLPPKTTNINSKVAPPPRVRTMQRGAYESRTSYNFARNRTAESTSSANYTNSYNNSSVNPPSTTHSGAAEQNHVKPTVSPIVIQQHDNSLHTSASTSSVQHNENKVAISSAPTQHTQSTQNMTTASQPMTTAHMIDVPRTTTTSEPKKKEKKEKKKFGLFKKKDKAVMDDFEISEPTAFQSTLSVNVDNKNSNNILNEYDGKEKAKIPLTPSVPLLTKKNISSLEEFLQLESEVNSMQLFFDSWSTPEVPKEKWIMEYPQEWEKKSLITEEVIKDGYDIEIGKGAVSNDTYLKDYKIVDVTSDFQFFERCVAGQSNVEHYVLTEEPTSVSIIPSNDGGFRKAFMMNKRGYTRFLVPHDVLKIRDFKPAFPDLSRGEFFKLNDAEKKEKFEKEMIRYERMSSIDHYKFGILYVKNGQTDENEMFSNTEYCPAFEKFLSLIGDKITLFEFTGYRGGLDVRAHSTGEYSYYTKYLRYEVMYHVSTLLPNQPDDLQRVEKKRHIGNDIVVIIFEEPDGNKQVQFNPKWLTSQFNHIFIVVKPDRSDASNDGYTCHVSCKSSVNPFPPFIEDDHFKHDEVFRDFIIRKCINGERTAMFSTAFNGNAIKVRKDQLSLLFKSLK